MKSNNNPLPSSSGYCQYGAKVLLHHLTILEKQIEGAKQNEDIEYVHQARVASRRTRAALTVFKSCFQKPVYKNWLSEIKKITQSLGHARDIDVQIIFLTTFLTTTDDSTLTKGVQHLLDHHKKKRVALQPTIITTLNEIQNTKVIPRIKTGCTHILNTSKTMQHPVTPYTALVTAQQHIRTQLHELFDLENYVLQPDAIQQHHEMRIAAKHLRYTMEIFNTLYENSLKQPITTIKKLQDILGDIHDSDVWIAYIPQYIEEIKQIQINQSSKKNIQTVQNGLILFLKYMRKRRTDLYTEFIDYWKKNRSILQELCTYTDYNLVIPSTKSFRIGLIADAHANLHAVQAVLNDAHKHHIDLFLYAGDFIGYGAFPNEVIQLLQSDNILSIKGNFDQNVLKYKKTKRKTSYDEKNIALDYAYKALTKTAKQFLKKLPTELKIRIGETTLLVTHGTPDSNTEYLRPTTPSARLHKITKTTPTDILIAGHSHVPFTKTINNVTIINPGSIGRPDDGNPTASYALLHLHPMNISFFRIPYDVSDAAQSIRQRKLPEHFAQMLEQGVSLETLQKQEDTKHMHLKPSDVVNQIRDVAKKYELETAHPEQVRKLALKLFDKLASFHHLTTYERNLLEYAALLHDIGWINGWKSHHKSSLHYILQDAELPFKDRERYIIANIARYHRKAFPSNKHKTFATVDSEDQERIRQLASLLRIADGLDASHTKAVKDIMIKTTDSEVHITCYTSGDTSHEARSVEKKKNLFETVFNRKVLITCKQRQKKK